MSIAAETAASVGHESFLRQRLEAAGIPVYGQSTVDLYKRSYGDVERRSTIRQMAIFEAILIGFAAAMCTSAVRILNFSSTRMGVLQYGLLIAGASIVLLIALASAFMLIAALIASFTSGKWVLVDYNERRTPTLIRQRVSLIRDLLPDATIMMGRFEGDPVLYVKPMDGPLICCGAWDQKGIVDPIDYLRAHPIRQGLRRFV